jgi:hypothetical protein
MRPGSDLLLDTIAGWGSSPSPAWPPASSRRSGGTRAVSASFLPGACLEFRVRPTVEGGHDIDRVLGAALVVDVLIEPQAVTVPEVEEQAPEGGHNSANEGDDEVHGRLHPGFLPRAPGAEPAGVGSLACGTAGRDRRTKQGRAD